MGFDPAPSEWSPSVQPVHVTKRSRSEAMDCAAQGQKFFLMMKSSIIRRVVGGFGLIWVQNGSNQSNGARMSIVHCVEIELEE